MIDRAIYKHLLVTDIPKNARDHWATSSYHMYIKEGDRKAQVNGGKLLVALLHTGDLVYIFDGHGFEIDRPGLIYIGEGFVHHEEDV